MIRILLVDDHQIIRDAIKQFLDGDDTVKVVGETSLVDVALKQIPVIQPDVIITDLSMPQKGG